MARAGADVGVGPAASAVPAVPAAAQRRRGDEHALRGAIDDFGDRPRGVEPVAVQPAVELAPVVAIDREPVNENGVGGDADAAETHTPAASYVAQCARQRVVPGTSGS